MTASVHPTLSVWRLGRVQRQELVRVGYAFVILSICIVAVTYLYVSHENTIYSSDYGAYHGIARDLLNHYNDSWRSALAALIRSTEAEYNSYFAIPLVPVLLLFGESRVAFEAGLAVVYLLPFTVLLAQIGTHLIPRRKLLVFWVTAASLLLTPMAWVPMLRGYPDTGASLFMCLALWAYVRHGALERASQAAIIGTAAALSIVFRRHFAYDVIALYVAMSLHMAARFALRSTSAPAQRSDLLRSIALLALAVASTVLVVLVLGWRIVYRGLTTDYLSLYAAYMSRPLVVLRWYVATFGVAFVAAALLGFLVAIRTAVADRRAAAFIVTFGAVSSLEWLFVVRQTGEQYTVHFTPVVVLGMAALVVTMWARLAGWRRAALVGGLASLMAVNMVEGLTAVEVTMRSALRPMFAMKERPLKRGDRDELAQLVSYLRETASRHEPIYVAASSPILEAGLVVNAERELYGSNAARLKVLYVPQIDSRDTFPLELLLPSDVVLVADPFQNHMGADKQRVVKVVYDLFRNNIGLARDFERLPPEFHLDEGAVVHVFKRRTATSIETAVATLRFIERNVQVRPGGQLDWMVLSPSYPFSIKRDTRNTYQARITLTRPASSPAALLYLGPLPETAAIRGRLVSNDACVPGPIRPARVSQDATSVELADAADTGEDGTFSFSFTKRQGSKLLLTIAPASEPPSGGCAFTIEDLRLVDGASARP